MNDQKKQFFQKRIPDKIDRAYIVTQLILNINQQALSGASGFIFGVNILEDNLAPHDDTYREHKKFVNDKVDAEMEKIEAGEESRYEIDNKIGQLEWRRARAKFQLLNELCKRTGLEKEMRIMLMEDYKEEVSDVVKHEVPDTPGGRNKKGPKGKPEKELLHNSNGENTDEEVNWDS